jgi:hypothetical protein
MPKAKKKAPSVKKKVKKKVIEVETKVVETNVLETFPSHKVYPNVPRKIDRVPPPKN